MNHEQIEDLGRRLQDLEARLGATCGSEASRPAFLHWSDVSTLREAIQTLDGLRANVRNVESALALAISVVRG